MKNIIIFFILLVFTNGCSLFFCDKEPKFKLSLVKVMSVYPNDKTDFFYASYEKLAFPDTNFSIKNYGDSITIPLSKSMNINYGEIDPFKAYLFCEIKNDSLKFKLLNPYEDVEISLNKLCKTYIVAHPYYTRIILDSRFKYEQLLWTPRLEGTWQVTLGGEDRECPKINRTFLNKARTKEYEKMIR